MVAQTPIPVSAKPGRVARYDYEYERREMVNIFALFEPKRGWRHLDVTERRTAVDLAQAMRRLADEHYPDAEKGRIVLDNLNTHTPASLYKAFEPEKSAAPLAVGWSFITHPNTPAGSTRWRSNSRRSRGRA